MAKPEHSTVSPTREPASAKSPWGKITWLTVASVVVLTIAFLVRRLIDGELPNSTAVPTSPFWLLAWHILVVVLWGLVAWFLILRQDRLSLREMGVRHGARALLMWSGGVLVAFLAILGAGTLAQGSEQLDPVPAVAPSVIGFVFVVLFGWVSQALPQELLWRGYLMRITNQNPLKGTLISANIYGLAHLIANWAEPNLLNRFLQAQVFGAFGGLGSTLIVLLRSWWPAFGIHCGYIVGSYVLSVLGTGTGIVLWGLQTIAFVILTIIAQGVGRKVLKQPLVLT